MAGGCMQFKLVNKETDDAEEELLLLLEDMGRFVSVLWW
jgi:hypothetical protein